MEQVTVVTKQAGNKQITDITKQLSHEDVNQFTSKINELVQYANNNTDVVGGKASAAQLSILEQTVNAINQLLTSDDTTLDQLQEIVNFIKQNKTDLDTLGISNIAGLVDALEGKAPTNHTHPNYDNNDLSLSVDYTTNQRGNGSTKYQEILLSLFSGINQIGLPLNINVDYEDWWFVETKDTANGNIVEQTDIPPTATVQFDGAEGVWDGVSWKFKVKPYHLIENTTGSQSIKAYTGKTIRFVGATVQSDANGVQVTYPGATAPMEFYLEEIFVFNNVNRYKFTVTFPSSAAGFGSQSVVSSNRFSSYSIKNLLTTTKGQANIGLVSSQINTTEFYIHTNVQFYTGTKVAVGRLATVDLDITTGSSIYVEFNGVNTITAKKRLSNVTTIASATIIPYDSNDRFYQIAVYRIGNTAYFKVKDQSNVVVLDTSASVAEITGTSPCNEGVFAIQSTLTATINNDMVNVEKLLVGKTIPNKLTSF